MAEQSLWYAENIDLETTLKTNKSVEAEFTARKVKFKKGDYIYLPEENSDTIYFIFSGKIKIGNYKDSDKEVITAMLQKGDVFGEVSIITDDKRKDFAQAAIESEVSVFKQEDFKKLMSENASLGLLFMKIMGNRVMEMEDRLESLVFKDSKTRIIEFLLLSIHKNGQRIGYEWVLRNFITHQDIANLTATSRQTVTMVLNDLRNQNIIQFDRKRLLVRDLEKLKSLINS
jgi:CRP-like cAMP-binding protein